MMKTIKASVLFAAAISAAVSMSCNKDATSPSEPEKKLSTITLTVESPSDDDVTKTQIGTPTGTYYPVNWSTDDAIAVSPQDGNGNSFEKYTLTDGAGTTSGTFTGTAVGGAVYAYYPYSQVKSVNEGTYTVNIPSQQTYVADSFGEGALPMYGTATGTGDLHSLVPLMAVLKLPLTGDCKVQRIVISSSSLKLSGSATVTYSGTEATLAMASSYGDAYDYVELVCGTAVQLSSTPVLFHIVVPATASSTQYTVRIITDESKVMEKSLAFTSKPLSAGKMTKTPELQDVAPTSVKYVEGSYCGAAVFRGGKWWAPVNCGYEAKNGTYNGYPYGKLYQWGRKYGQGYNNTDATYPSGGNLLSTVASSVAEGNKEENAAKFFGVGQDYWANGGTTGDTWFATYNPCPKGWCVPAKSDYTNLITAGSLTETTEKTGYKFGDDLFFQYAGYRSYTTGNVAGRTTDWQRYGQYWASDCNGDDGAWLMTMVGGATPNQNSHIYRISGLSVRCIRQ